MARILGTSLLTILVASLGAHSMPMASATDTPPTSNSGNPVRLPEESHLPGILGSGNTERSGQSPTLTLDKPRGLAGGDKIKATGEGYTPGESIYVTQTIEKPSAGFPKEYGKAVKVKANDQGNFTTELKVDTKFKDVDCTVTQCYIASFTAFPKLFDRSQDAWTPITFQTGAAVTIDTDGGHDGDNNDDKGSEGSAVPPGSTSSSGATVDVNKTTELNPGGDTVTVHGRGFTTEGEGIYVGLAQQNQFSTTNADVFGPGTVWVSRNKGNLNADGSFSVDLPVSATFGNSNCLANACAIYTLAAHGSHDRSQDTATPVSFLGGVPVTNMQQAARSVEAPPGNNSTSPDGSTTGYGLNQASGASGSTGQSRSGARVSVSRTTISPTGKTPIAITGQGFTSSGSGVYVGLAEKAKFSTTDASVFGATTWVRPQQMSPNGSFTTTLNIEPIFKAGNCIKNQCAIVTFAAHGSADRSQDTVTDITVTGTQQDKDAAIKEAAKKAESQKKAEEARKKARQEKKKQAVTTQANSTSDGVDNQATGIKNTSSNSRWLYGGLIGALGALAIIFAVLFGIEKRRNLSAHDKHMGENNSPGEP